MICKIVRRNNGSFVMKVHDVNGNTLTAIPETFDRVFSAGIGRPLYWDDYLQTVYLEDGMYLELKLR